MYEFQVLSSGTNVALQGSVSHHVITIVIWTDMQWIFRLLDAPINFGEDD